jgi:hypothetical protein
LPLLSSQNSESFVFGVLSAVWSFDWWKDVAVTLVSWLILTGTAYDDFDFSALF